MSETIDVQSINPDDGVLVVMPAHRDYFFPEKYRETLQAQFEAAGFRRVVVLAQQATFAWPGEAANSGKVKFIVNVPESRMGYSAMMNIARTVRAMIDLVEQESGE